MENYYNSVYSILVIERLTSENKQTLKSSDFHEAVLWEGIDPLSGEHKSSDNVP